MMMHRAKLILLFLGMTMPLVPTAAVADTPRGVETPTEELNLAVGENRTISAVDVRNYSEGVKGIVDVKLTTDRSQFVIVGQKAGNTTLLLIKSDGTQVTWL